MASASARKQYRNATANVAASVWQWHPSTSRQLQLAAWLAAWPRLPGYVASTTEASGEMQRESLWRPG